MKQPLRRLTKSDVQRAVGNNQERIKSVTAYALKLNSDPDKKARREKSLCVCCYYRGATLAGQAFTESPCGICEKEMRFSSTHTDKLCLGCAVTHKLCKECGATSELQEPRWLKSDEIRSPSSSS
jgi:hypothetical protein